MNGQKRHLISQWLEKAEHDLVAAGILIDANPLILDIACFHCQQSIEKYLKAFLVYHEIDFHFTHNIDYLLDKCGKIDAVFANVDTKNLNAFATRARYPDSSILPDIGEAQEYYEIASRIKSLVLSRIL